MAFHHVNNFKRERFSIRKGERGLALPFFCMRNEYLEGSLNPACALKSIKYKIDFARENPDYFKPEGILIFCGSQGSGKTLSAVQYVLELCRAYPKAILCTNVDIFTLPEHTRVIEYDGLECLKNIENGQNGVIYFIDEIHLELNSLESKNIDMDTIVELSQQRKQRKHIVGTSQVYMRMAKPLREQVKDVILCTNFFHLFQFNKHIDGFSSYEENGHLKYETLGVYMWFHSPDLYKSYDTYAKMRRYKKEWKGRLQSGSWS